MTLSFARIGSSVNDIVSYHIYEKFGIIDAFWAGLILLSFGLIFLLFLISFHKKREIIFKHYLLSIKEHYAQAVIAEATFALNFPQPLSRQGTPIGGPIGGPISSSFKTPPPSHTRERVGAGTSISSVTPLTPRIASSGTSRTSATSATSASRTQYTNFGAPLTPRYEYSRDSNLDFNYDFNKNFSLNNNNRQKTPSKETKDKKCNNININSSNNNEKTEITIETKTKEKQKHKDINININKRNDNNSKSRFRWSDLTKFDICFWLLTLNVCCFLFRGFVVVIFALCFAKMAHLTNFFVYFNRMT